MRAFRSARGIFAISIAAALAGPGCSKHTDDGAPRDAALDAAPPWGVTESSPEPRPGMVWIPQGALIAGTPPDHLPRIADEEMAGEQVVMHGFYIDVYPHPNEIGAIPTTNVTQAEAKLLCEQQNKRLCTELEWERACKGPQNTTYEYGDGYKPQVCGTGSDRVLVPNGMNPACQSAFGVHDLHGGIWTWTASAWKREGARPGLVTMRGGNGREGDLVGRCANGRGLKPDTKHEDIGVRCCAGEVNSFEVELAVVRGELLEWQAPDPRIAPELERVARGELVAQGAALADDAMFKVERTWKWRPIGNEEIVVAGGCARSREHNACGVLLARVRFDKVALLAFASTDWWQPTVGEADSPRELLLYGGDFEGAFRRKLTYEWGKIAVGAKERKKKRKGHEPSYD